MPYSVVTFGSKKVQEIGPHQALFKYFYFYIGLLQKRGDYLMEKLNFGFYVVYFMSPPPPPGPYPENEKFKVFWRT